jgi:starvation-inducible DNA-binding protein
MTLEVHLSKCLATTFAFGLKAQNFHWNVEGSNFYEYHLLFDKIQEGTYKTLDCLAEATRTLSVYVPANFEDLKTLSVIQDTRTVPANKEMLAILLADCRLLMNTFIAANTVSTAAGNHAICNLLGHHLQKFKKYEYLLISANKP